MTTPPSPDSPPEFPEDYTLIDTEDAVNNLVVNSTTTSARDIRRGLYQNIRIPGFGTLSFKHTLDTENSIKHHRYFLQALNFNIHQAHRNLWRSIENKPENIYETDNGEEMKSVLNRLIAFGTRGVAMGGRRKSRRNKGRKSRRH